MSHRPSIPTILNLGSRDSETFWGLVLVAIAIIGFEAKGTDPTPSRLTMPRPDRLPNVVPVCAERPQVQDIAEKLRETRDRISDLMVRL